MELEMYVILLMFVVSGVGFIAAINSHGTVRTVLSYVLAGLILITSAFTLVHYNSQTVMRELAKKEAMLAEQTRQAELLKQQQAEEAARAAAALAVQSNAGGPFQEQLSKIANQGLDIARGILAVNVEAEMPEAAYDATTKKAGGYKAGALDLKKQIETAFAAPPAGQDVSASKELLDKAVRELGVGANYFSLYFKAEDENQENERYDTYQQNTKAAKADFTKALEKLSGK
jgi:hypothetical protein